MDSHFSYYFVVSVNFFFGIVPSVRTIVIIIFLLLLLCWFFFVIVAYVNKPATLHSFLNVCTGWHPSTVLTVLSVYLTGLATFNVYWTYVLQYSFVPFFDSVICSEIVQYCSSPTLRVHWLMLVHWFVQCCLLLFDSTLQNWGPVAAVGPLGACSLVCLLLLDFGFFGSARLGSCTNN